MILLPFLLDLATLREAALKKQGQAAWLRLFSACRGRELMVHDEGRVVKGEVARACACVVMQWHGLVFVCVCACMCVCVCTQTVTALILLSGVMQADRFSGIDDEVKTEIHRNHRLGVRKGCDYMQSYTSARRHNSWRSCLMRSLAARAALWLALTRACMCGLLFEMRAAGRQWDRCVTVWVLACVTDCQVTPTTTRRWTCSAYENTLELLYLHSVVMISCLY